MVETNACMMGVSLLNKYMAIKAPHFIDTDDSYAAERLRIYIQDLSLCHVTPQHAIGCSLKSE